MMKVLRKRCPECLFTDARIVSERRAADIIRECARKDTHFICHRATMNGFEAVCRGFYDQSTSQMIRIAQRLNGLEFIDVPERP
jgi:hypothetical protein